MNPRYFDLRPSKQTISNENLVSDFRFQLTFILLFSTLLIFSKLGGNGLANYDDCYYAQKAKEILQTGNWMTLHYNHAPSFDNPPFFIWLVSISFSVFGVSEYSAKLPSALMGVMTILLVYFLAKKLFNAWIGFFSSFILTTTSIFVKYSRHVMMDVTLTFFVCLSMFSLILSLRRNPRYFLLWGISIGICILIKSVLGLFPWIITVIYLLITKRWKIVFNGYFLTGCFLSALIGSSWFLHQYGNYGSTFVNVHFGWLIFERGFSLQPQPWYYHLSYLYDLLRYYWPWLPLLVLGFTKLSKRTLKSDENAIFLLLWMTTIIAVMSVMMSRKIWYIMPIFPATAIISGYALFALLNGQGRVVFAKGCFGLGIIAMILITATPIQIESQREKDVRMIAPYIEHLADQNAKIIAFRKDYHGLNNALLFYSDHAASPIFQEYSELSNALADSSIILCILNLSELDGVVQNIRNISVIRKTSRLALISNHPLDSSGIKTW